MFRFPASLRRFLLPLLGVGALLLAGCGDNERLSYATEADEPAYREGQALLKSGRQQEALNAFLRVIDKRGEDAPESHLEVGLLYLQSINDPLSAIYHFRRYLALRPNSPQAPLVRQRIDAATRDFARTLPAQPLESQLQRVDLMAALDRLRQENESLKQELADLKAGRENPTLAPANNGRPAGAGATSGSFDPLSAAAPVLRTPRSPGQPARAAVKPAAGGGRMYTVKPGDTLSKIALQVYGSRAKWHEIYAANRRVMRSETDLKVGMELALP